MKKADRQHRFGSTYGKMAKAGWWNWYMARGRMADDTAKAMRRVSWRRAL